MGLLFYSNTLNELFIYDLDFDNTIFRTEVVCSPNDPDDLEDGGYSFKDLNDLIGDDLVFIGSYGDE